jgi:hypothetical protein
MAEKKGALMPQQIEWKKLIGQSKVKETLAQAYRGGHLGHAYLFCGPEGVGKFQAALELSLALHCEHPGIVPCYECDSCRKLLNYADPDFHCVFPVALESNHKSGSQGSDLSEEGWNYINEITMARLANPYQVSGTKLLNIPIDWIRELNESIMRGSTSGKINIAVIGDVDLMQAGAANAMLKTLEEPPPKTLMLLLTKNLFSTPPTIRSRCQVIRFGTISGSELSAGLCGKFSFPENDQKLKQIIVCSGGSFGIACSLVDESMDIYFEQASTLFRICVADTPPDVFTMTIEKVLNAVCSNSQDYLSAEKLLKAFFQIVRAIFFHNMGYKENYFIGILKNDTPAPQIDAGTTIALRAECESALSAIQARGNINLVVITFLMTIVELFHGEKY